MLNTIRIALLVVGVSRNIIVSIGIHSTIAAGSTFDTTRATATVSVTDVAVIAFLRPLDHGIAASQSHCAIIFAGVVIIGICVITFLCTIHNAIATDNGFGAIIFATITIVPVTVVAFFDATLHDPIATACISALIGAAVGIGIIPVVALLHSTNETVSTALESAIQTIDRCITFLWWFHDSIATDCGGGGTCTGGSTRANNQLRSTFLI